MNMILAPCKVEDVILRDRFGTYVDSRELIKHPVLGGGDTLQVLLGTTSLSKKIQSAKDAGRMSSTMAVEAAGQKRRPEKRCEVRGPQCSHGGIHKGPTGNMGKFVIC